ncbi:MAG: DUF2804 domain-containing protein [Treponema sp.]|jgi:hypothetical protein|nr:DUF2804 domain-containing protein [Treponema sp.]
MYTREILDPRPSPIEDGIPLQGTWNRAFEMVDLLEIYRPYRFPLPRWARDNRIKEWECFSVHDDRVFLEAFLCNVKLYRIAQVFLYDKENGEKYLFRKILPGSGWRLPRSLGNAAVDSHSSRFFFRIHSWLDADTIKLDLDIQAARRRPPLTAHLAYNMNRQHVAPMAVSLGFTERRNMYAFKVMAAVRGDMVFNGRHISLGQDHCSGIFCDYKGFFPYRMREQACSAAGFDAEGRRFGFHIAENQTRETHKNNENALWVNGRLTPLPPVRITMPEGPESDWIIQDVEGMVDLVFTPKMQNRARAEFVFTSAEFDAPLGQYNGMLMSAGGEQIQVRGLIGMGEKLYLRV